MIDRAKVIQIGPFYKMIFTVSDIYDLSRVRLL